MTKNSAIFYFVVIHSRDLKEGHFRREFDISTGDESYFYHYDPKTKDQSKVLISETDPHSIKVHRNKSFDKMMVPDFPFINSSLIKLAPLEIGVIVNANWYISTYLS